MGCHFLLQMCVCVHILFNYGLSQDNVYRTCCLFILYIIVCICEFQTPSPYPTLPTLWQSQVCSLRTWTFKVFNSCSVTKLYLTFYDPMDCNTPGFPVLHYLPKFAQTHVHWVGDAIQLSHPLSPLSPPALNLSQHQGLSQWVGSLHQVAKVLELQLQHQSFWWIFRVDFL